MPSIVTLKQKEPARYICRSSRGGVAADHAAMRMVRPARPSTGEVMSQAPTNRLIAPPSRFMLHPGALTPHSWSPCTTCTTPPGTESKGGTSGAAKEEAGVSETCVSSLCQVHTVRHILLGITTHGTRGPTEQLAFPGQNAPSAKSGTEVPTTRSYVRM